MRTPPWIDRRDVLVCCALAQAVTEGFTDTARPASDGSTPHGTSCSSAVGTITSGPSPAAMSLGTTSRGQLGRGHLQQLLGGVT